MKTGGMTRGGRRGFLDEVALLTYMRAAQNNPKGRFKVTTHTSWGCVSGYFKTAQNTCPIPLV